MSLQYNMAASRIGARCGVAEREEPAAWTPVKGDGIAGRR